VQVSASHNLEIAQIERVHTTLLFIGLPTRMYIIICLYLYFYYCRYGLIIPKRADKSKRAVNPASVFGNDDDDDQVCKDTSIY